MVCRPLPLGSDEASAEENAYCYDCGKACDDKDEADASCIGMRMNARVVPAERVGVGEDLGAIMVRVGLAWASMGSVRVALACIRR